MSRQLTSETDTQDGGTLPNSLTQNNETWIALEHVSSRKMSSPQLSPKFSGSPKGGKNKVKRTFHINVLLDTKSCDTVGLIIIKGKRESSLTLHYVRKCIKRQFDSDQIDTLGGADRFKFLRKSVPISKRQEKEIHIRECHDPRQQIKSCFVALHFPLHLL